MYKISEELIKECKKELRDYQKFLNLKAKKLKLPPLLKKGLLHGVDNVLKKLEEYNL